MLGEVTTVYVFLIELGSLLLYCYRVFGVRRRIPSTLLMGIACFAVYYTINDRPFEALNMPINSRLFNI